MDGRYTYSAKAPHDMEAVVVLKQGLRCSEIYFSVLESQTIFFKKCFLAFIIFNCKGNTKTKGGARVGKIVCQQAHFVLLPFTGIRGFNYLFVFMQITLLNNIM